MLQNIRKVLGNVSIDKGSVLGFYVIYGNVTVNSQKLTAAGIAYTVFGDSIRIAK